MRLSNAIRDPSPCLGCTERFRACSDNCPKDARGEKGHKAWKNEIQRVKAEKQRYLDRVNVRRKNYNGGNYGQE
jgi:Fe-S-cluster-containing dehydrogenase component